MSRSWRCSVIALSVFSACFSVGCEETVATAPPNIYYGQDVCDVCGMIISDDRFAAGLVLTSDGDTFETLAFDDIGCMLAYEASHPSRVVAARYVQDFGAARWLDAENAFYAHSRKLHSPMAFGVAACPLEAGAQSLVAEYPGETLDFQTVRSRFANGTLINAPVGPTGSDSSAGP